MCPLGSSTLVKLRLVPSSPERQSGPIESGYRVIVADDSADSRLLLTTALASARFAVTQAHDGKELYDLLTTSSPGYFKLVVTDHAMPRMFGTEVLARTSARAPFIIVTGVATPELEEAAERYGAAAFFTKPIDVRAFLRTVDDVVFGQRA